MFLVFDVLALVALPGSASRGTECCGDELIGRFVHKVMSEELMNTLNLPMDELRKFAADVMDRFRNPFVKHFVTSIMLNSFPKYKTRDLPGLKTYLERKGEPSGRSSSCLAGQQGDDLVFRSGAEIT